MTPEQVLSFCFPADLARDLETHIAYWGWTMRGGADKEIVSRFADLVPMAAAGECDSWAAEPRGRLALILVLDQFPRSVYRDDPAAYATDSMALKWVEAGIANQHFAALEHPWERTLYALPLVHAEGSDLAARAALNVALAEETLTLAPEMLKPAYQFCLAQSLRHKSVIDRFGRHPHRNAILGRQSTSEEVAYLRTGEFPHRREVAVDTS
ncbi:MAG: DUF924 domain-containing protein [Myxococcales bacterium]|nr:DUF924 domain-containing protein [Myxococcales bacterium]